MYPFKKLKECKCDKNGAIGYCISSKKKYKALDYFESKDIVKVFNFAYEMAFGSGKHRNHRSGGNARRKKGQIFINTFQGKLAELAVYKEFEKHNPKAYKKLSGIDFSVYGLGEWDSYDLSMEDKKFSVKSTKFYGHLLLLETKDWNEDGEYLPNKQVGKPCTYDYFVLVRISPDGESLMKKEKLLYSNNIDKEKLKGIIESQKWEYDIPGYISHDDLKYIISNKFIIQKGDLLNCKIEMDADNYYVQSGDLRCFTELIKSL
ncbi:hypothetical protein GWK41_10100 [Persephonella atlantica]|uniref:Uncharacterized protein n=1 Tax=Persephonella atlantica TaxID=2699429 RepID=A0ABS1GKG9_9AQUI|nr:hypothetical protein [Persephonella atlantica]MBK3333415.1 hypothetical protein [Persephonella atlantica]